MKPARWATLAAWAAGWLPVAPTSAAERFPPPQFETGHALPTTAMPAPDAMGWDAIDVTVLAVAIALASWLILRRRWRAGVLTVAAISLLYFGFWREGCVCAIGSIQNVALALGDTSYAIPAAAAAFFALPLVAALFFGRTFCAAVCPQGAIQELMILRPVTVPAWLDRPLGLLRYLYLALAVLLAWTGSAFIICEYDPFVGFFRLSASPAMTFFGAALLISGIFIARPYCRYLCPFGVLLGWMATGSKWHAKIDPQGCVSCHLCAKSCPVNAIDTGVEQTGAAEDAGKRRRRVMSLMLALPLLVLLGAAAGYGSSAQLARMHNTVHLAERIAEEEMGVVRGTTDAVKAFRATAELPATLYARAEVVRSRFARSASIAGGFLGLVLGLSLLRSALRRAGRTYDIDRARCVSCARCFDHCPHEPARLVALTTPATPKDSFRRRHRAAAIGVGVAAAAFSAVVAASLMINHRQLVQNNPLTDPHMMELRSKLREKPGVIYLAEQIRQRDQVVRTRLLEARAFSTIGGWLLLTGVATAAGAFTFARRRREPAASELAAMTRGQHDQVQYRERWAIAFVGLAVLSAALVAAIRPVVPLAVATDVPAAPKLLEMDPTWPAFRGRSGSGVCGDSDRFTYPRQWNGPAGVNLRWKAALALPGRNSPVVCGDRVFCTGADETRREVYCYDAATGALRWSRRVDAGRAGREPLEVEGDTGHAAPTAATDGRRVYAIFANGDLAAFDLDGRPVWSHALGEPQSMYGYASSLAVYEQTVIVQWDQGQPEENLSKLIAFDGATGTKRWETSRPVGGSWASPVIIQTAGTPAKQLITIAQPSVIAYDPTNGQELWRCELIDADAAPSPVGSGDKVYIVNPSDRLAALPTSERGTLKEDRAAWFYDGCAPDITSPLFDGRYVYVLATSGELHCIRAADGAAVWTHEFDGASFHASPTLIGDTLYLTSTAGMTYLVRAGETFELLGAADLDERVEASLATAGGSIFIRGETHLFCIGRKDHD